MSCAGQALLPRRCGSGQHHRQAQQPCERMVAVGLEYQLDGPKDLSDNRSQVRKRHRGGPCSGDRGRSACEPRGSLPAQRSEVNRPG